MENLLTDIAERSIKIEGDDRSKEMSFEIGRAHV